MSLKTGDILGILTGGLLGDVKRSSDFFTDGWYEYYNNVSTSVDVINVILSTNDPQISTPGSVIVTSDVINLNGTINDAVITVNGNILVVGDILGRLTGGILGNVNRPIDYFTDGWYQSSDTTVSVINDITVINSTFSINDPVISTQGSTSVVVNSDLIDFTFNVNNVEITTDGNITILNNVIDLNASLNNPTLTTTSIINTSPIDLTISALNVDITNQRIWTIGSTQTIRWDFVDVLSDVKIELSRDNGNSWEIITSATTNDGSYDWVVTAPSSSLSLIRVSGLIYVDPIDGSEIDFTDIVDVSDNVFTIIGISVITNVDLIDLNTSILETSVSISTVIDADINNLLFSINEVGYGAIDVICEVDNINIISNIIPNGVYVEVSDQNSTQSDYISSSGNLIRSNFSIIPNNLTLSGNIQTVNYIETGIGVNAVALNLVVPLYQALQTSLFSDFGSNYGMGNGTNMKNGWLTKCDPVYNNERKLFDCLITEAYNQHGVCLVYYVTSYNKNYDKVWGEDNNRFFERKFNFMAYYSLPREEKMWSKFGIQGMDTFSMFVSKLHFRDASTYGMTNVNSNQINTYQPYIPLVGDIIKSEYNNYIYEIVEVKEEIGMYLLSKQHIWEFIVKPYKDEHISLSATTSAGMSEISAYTNKSSDVFNISDVVDNKKDLYNGNIKNEIPSKDYFNNW